MLRYPNGGYEKEDALLQKAVYTRHNLWSSLSSRKQRMLRGLPYLGYCSGNLLVSEGSNIEYVHFQKL